MGLFDVIKGIVKAPFDIVKGIVGGGNNKADKENQRLLNQQIKDYKEQTRITNAELARVKDEKMAEKRRINEKQIRSLRGKGSSRGFLGSSNPEGNVPGMTSQLGG
jgi:predicted DNA binding CopG/RHH family protein